MTKKPILKQIGGNEEQLFAFDFENQEIYARDNDTQSVVWKAIGLGSVIGTGLYGGLFYFYTRVPPLYWVILSTLTLIVIVFMVVKLKLLIAEHCTNYENFERLGSIDNIDIKSLKILKETKDGVGAFVFLGTFSVIGLAVALPLANAYIMSPDIEMWLMYILATLLVQVGLYSCWFIARQKNMKNLVLNKLNTNKEMKE